MLQLHDVAPTEISFLLTDDQTVRELNREHRGIDSVTDVLSFPSGQLPGSALGDVVIAVPHAREQADARGVPLQEELALLAVHGALHLLGFDDRTENEREAMLHQMNKAMCAAGLPPCHDWSSLKNG